MNLELDDSFHIWKIKLELAQQGSAQAIQQLKTHCFLNQHQNPTVQANFYQILKNAQMRFIKENDIYGNYQLYTDFPAFLLLEGSVELRCLNLQGDQQAICKYDDKGFINVNNTQLQQKFGQNNANILTKFQLLALKKTILIQINPQNLIKIANKSEQKNKVTIRQQTIMKRYMLFPLKYIRIQESSKEKTFQQKIYLLQGKACYYFDGPKQKIVLSFYDQGYFNPKQFTNSQIKLFIFEKSKILTFQQEFLKQDYVHAVQLKRQEHLKHIIEKYNKLSPQQKQKIQTKLITQHKLIKKWVDKQILGIQPASTQKRITSKNDLISTSSSIKQKCKIRISKKKKIM